MKGESRFSASPFPVSGRAGSAAGAASHTADELRAVTTTKWKDLPYIHARISLTSVPACARSHGRARPTHEESPERPLQRRHRARAQGAQPAAAPELRRPVPAALPAPTCRRRRGQHPADSEEERAGQQSCRGHSHGSTAPARPLAPTSRQGAGPAGKGGVTGRDGPARPGNPSRAGGAARPRHLGSTAPGSGLCSDGSIPRSRTALPLLSPLCAPCAAPALPSAPRRCLPHAQHRDSRNQFNWKRLWDHWVPLRWSRRCLPEPGLGRAAVAEPQGRRRCPHSPCGTAPAPPPAPRPPCFRTRRCSAAADSRRARSASQSRFPFTTGCTLVCYSYWTVPQTGMVRVLYQESSYVSTSPSSSLDVGAVIQPLAQCVFSKSLLKIQLISTVLVCAKNAYCSFSSDLPSTNFPKHPLLQPFPNTIWSIGILLSHFLWVRCTKFSKIFSELGIGHKCYFD